jgi:serine protease Do
VAERVIPSVVNISTERSAGSMGGGGRGNPFFHFFGPQGPGMGPPVQGQGSGVIVSADGVILTNNHVVQGARKIQVTLVDRRELTAKLVGADPKSDLAVLRLTESAKDLKPLVFGDSDKLRLGEVVLAVGNPFGVGQTVTMGIVSAKGRSNVGIVDYEDFIQTDAAINPGNSGGALVDMHGRLVGVNTAILSRSGGYQGIGFAIPARQAKHVMGSLLRHGKVQRGFLGVRIQTVSPDLAKGMGLGSQRGVLISDVDPGSAAERAGLRRGDVVLEVDGQAVDTASRLRSLVANSAPGARVQLKVKRGSQDLQVTVTLGALDGGPLARRPGPAQGAPAAPSDSLTMDGLTVAPLTPERRAKHRLPSRLSSGLVVTAVAAGSKADQAGLEEGDVILEVNRRDVTSLKRFRVFYEQASGYVVLLVFRNGGTHFLALQK